MSERRKAPVHRPGTAGVAVGPDPDPEVAIGGSAGGRGPGPRAEIG